MSVGRLSVPRVDGRRLAAGLLLVNTEFLLVLAYLSVAPVGDVDPVLVAVPFVWINVALWGVWRVGLPRAGSRRARWLAAGVGVGYFLLLAWVGGLLSTGHGGHAHIHATVHWVLPPGWGPALSLSGGGLSATLIPYKVVGYAALAYLVAATVLDASAGALGGLVGLFACVSCTWPVLGTVLAGLLGGGSALAAVATGQPYQVSTLVFVTAVGLLAARPSL